MKSVSKVLKEIDVADASGTIESMKVVSLPSININKLVFKDTPAMVSKDSKIFLDCFGADGFIGSNMLRNSAVQFNHFTKTITITDDPKLLNLNKKNAAKMELTSTQSDPYIWIKLRNGKVVANEKILFDTGDDSFYVLSMSAYEQITKQLDLFKVIGQSTGSFSAGLHGSGGTRAARVAAAHGAKVAVAEEYRVGGTCVPPRSAHVAS